MQFREFAENLLGSKVKIKLLRHLLKEETITSERELAKLIGVSHGAVNKALKELHDSNLITPLRVGNVIVWNLNEQSYAYDFLRSFSYKIKEMPRDHLISTINSYLSSGFAIEKVVLFGSVAEGRELPNSDIDLFILVENDNIRKSVLNHITNLTNRCLMLYGNKVSPYIFTKKEVETPSKVNKEFLENVKKGIVVFEK